MTSLQATRATAPCPPGRHKLLIFIVAYNATGHIERVLDRIPAEIWNPAQYDTEVLIIDDASKDNTAQLASVYKAVHHKANLRVLRNPVNQGYGGNQKIGYHYAITHGFDVVALLHGDGQYAPEMLPALIAPIIENRADAVFGSRMLRKREALAGGMPRYKFIGNRVLTGLQNRILGSRLSEFHSGYRVYAVRALAQLPFACNSNDYDFDTDIIIQLMDTKHAILEMPIPTFYGNEICYVNGLRYACQIIASTLQSRLQRLNIYYHPKFDYEGSATDYPAKLGFPSSHQVAIDAVPPNAVVLDIGCGSGHVARELRKKGCRIIGVDKYMPDAARASFDAAYALDIDDPHMPIPFEGERLDVILLLDVIEHFRQPEEFLKALRQRFARFRPLVVITTGNVGFLITRLNLLLGNFNYGKRGILDMTHTRLFTRRSLADVLEHTGYVVARTQGIPAPFPLVFKQRGLAGLCLRLNQMLIWLHTGLFAYQNACIARMTPTLDLLLEDAAHGVDGHQ